MTHSQEQNSGWIEHDTTECPVDADCVVVVRLRNGDQGPAIGARADCFWWGKKAGSSGEIVAYKVHTPSPSSQGDEQ